MHVVGTSSVSPIFVYTISVIQVESMLISVRITVGNTSRCDEGFAGFCVLLFVSASETETSDNTISASKFRFRMGQVGNDAAWDPVISQCFSGTVTPPSQSDSY